MNIYQIKQELLAIFDELEENGGELTPELEEQLSITQECFKEKVKNYINVIKSLQNDITAIKDEKNRLSDLQKSKEKSIERIKNIIVNAIELFGDTSKSGSKFVDYETGKISIRNTEIVDVDEDQVNKFVDRYIAGLQWYKSLNQLDNNILTIEEILEFANDVKYDENDDYIPQLTLDDLQYIDVNINTKVKLKDLIQSETGFNLAKTLINYGIFNTKATIDKLNIKKDIKDTGFISPYATLNQNKSLIIR